MATSTRARSAKTTPAAVEAPQFSLEKVIEATLNDSFVYTPDEFHAPLVVSGDVEVNPGMVEENTGYLATRATAKHLTKDTNMTTANTEVTQTAKPVTAKPTFVIEANIAMPERKRGANLNAGRAAKYPFDALEVGQSFFVANDPESKKTAYEAMQSTVASANNRYREELPGTSRVINRGKGSGKTALDYIETRKFKIFDTTRDGTAETEKGARIFRVAPEKTAPAA